VRIDRIEDVRKRIHDLKDKKKPAGSSPRFDS
jgi:hypothetical protein